ncbi:hypothetical protein DNK06_23270 [Pseudomonas daroniae]|uniref:Uncharacterized protein n=1 Tax=Phytopseudomonas daroniae TaxID=2487519 RepID=A0A4Q9QGI3_9GAMM|nr:hypothetical protein DNK06_23270 [Pseudomonas daroniae]TBU78150.1 hypothetical protein DNK31_20415 [Pseudomonas sp. FRB 228]TBU87966.1 hypothetical protein DNJ99_20640 [Pseudomonas daroniae]
MSCRTPSPVRTQPLSPAIGADTVAARWHADGGGLRSRVHRLVRCGRLLVDGGCRRST